LDKLTDALGDTHILTEDIAQHKYSRLANASYEYFNSNGDASKVREGLADPKYKYIKGLKDFKVDENLSIN